LSLGLTTSAAKPVRDGKRSNLTKKKRKGEDKSWGNVEEGEVKG
jgi:hypothetical protein